MFSRVLQVIAVIAYIFGAIGGVAYFDGSFFLLIPLLAPVLYFLFTLPDLADSQPAPVLSESEQRISAERLAKINERVAELQNGPAHRNQEKYIDSVSRGIPYSDEQIDYLEFPEKLVLCEHLRPLEAAMRAARVPMEYYGQKAVEVFRVMRVSLIRERYPLAECVEFGQGSGVDRHAPLVNVVRCKSCGDSLEERGFNCGPWPEN